MKKFILFALFAVGLNQIQAQHHFEQDIVVYKDSRVDHYLQVEKKNDKMWGYRIQICQDANKSIVDRSRDKFLKLYPLTDTYIRFENPNYTLKVGDYRSRDEAEKIKREIFGEFIISVVQKELINLPRID